MTNVKTIILFFIACVLSAASAYGQVTVKAQASDDIYIGEPFSFEIVIVNPKGEPEIDISPLAEFSPQYRGIQSSSSSGFSMTVNGRRVDSGGNSSQQIISYSMLATKAGSQIIPAIEVTVDGQKYKTRPVSINVRRPENSDKLDLLVQISDTTCYVGQPIRIAYIWYYDPSLGNGSLAGISAPALVDEDNFIIEEMNNPPGTGNKGMEIQLGTKTIVGRQYETTYKGKNHIAISFGSILVPQKTGNIKLEPATVACKVETSRRRSLFEQPTYARYQAVSKPVYLNVRPLPEDGKPQNFNGLLGTYQIVSSAAPTEVSEGDPIELTIKVSGQLLKAVQLPDLNNVKGFPGNFKIPNEIDKPTIENGIKTFKYIIRATNAEINEIPAVPLSFFDTNKDQYITVASEPIAIKVKAAEFHSSTQAIGNDIIINPTVTLVESSAQGIAANHNGPELFQQNHFSLLATIWNPITIAILALPFVLFCIALGVRIANSSNPVRHRQKLRSNAGRNAIATLNKIKTSDTDKLNLAALEALRTFIADRYDRTAQSLTENDCKELLTNDNYNQQLIDEFVNFFQQASQTRYAAGNCRPVNIDQIINLIRNLQR
ncbi:MAG: protein BatD [Phycisphaerae bacterium]|nr:protein BatD [Phycisphaerae bacterium]